VGNGESGDETADAVLGLEGAGEVDVVIIYFLVNYQFAVNV